MTDEQRVLLIQDHIDETENMTALWESCGSMVKKIAARYKAYEEYDDLVQQAYFGLCKAVENYIPDTGTPFKNYAAYWIRQALLRYIYNRPLIRVPEWQAHRVRIYNRRVTELEQQLGREPTDAEITQATGYSQPTIDKIRNAALKISTLSLDAPPPGSDPEVSPLGELLPDRAEPYKETEEYLEREQLRTLLQARIKKLPKSQQEVIQLHYLDGFTLGQIAQIKGIDYHAVYNARNRAFKSLRLTRYLKEFIESDAYQGTSLSAFRRTGMSAPERITIYKLDKIKA